MSAKGVLAEAITHQALVAVVRKSLQVPEAGGFVEAHPQPPPLVADLVAEQGEGPRIRHRVAVEVSKQGQTRP